jgi:hypothetical protein
MDTNMSKRNMIILGVAGAVATAAVIGGVVLYNPHPDRETASQQTGGEMEQYLKQIRTYDKEKQDLLEALVFYQGNATIQETYTAASGMGGDTPVIGSVAMVSEDICAYDERTKKCFLVARRISLLGDDVKSFDIPRIYTGTVTVKVSGILTEYYGNGILQAYDVADALNGKKGYYLNFSANPVRMDSDSEIIYTNPPVKNTYWVQVIGPDSVDMVATGVFTPEELPSVDTGLIPGISQVSGKNSYNSRQTLIYEYTGGKIVPKGTFSFDYKKMSYSEVKDFLDELKMEAQKDKLLEDAAENLSDTWKDVITAEQELKTIIDASESIKSYADHFSGENTADTTNAKGEAEMLANGVDFRGELNRAVDTLDTLVSDEGALRSLEGFSLDGGEGDHREATDAMGSLLPVLKEHLLIFRKTVTSLQKNTDDLRTALSGKKVLETDAQRVLKEIRTGAKELERLGTCLEQMSSDFYSVLLSYIQGEGKNDTEYAALARLCRLWESTLHDLLSDSAPLTDTGKGITIPDEYPAGAVPLLKNSIAAIYNTEEDGTIMVTLKTNMAPKDVITYYKGVLSRTKNLSSFSMSGMWTLTGETKGYELSILASSNQLGGSEPTMVQITLIPGH